MGNDISQIEVNANDKYVNMSGLGMKTIAVKIPFDAKTQILDLNRNQLRELPNGIFQLRSISLQNNGLPITLWILSADMIRAYSLCELSITNWFLLE